MASGPITSWQIDGETVETVADFIFWGSKITADGDCRQEIKRCLFRGRKAMTKLDSTLKSRDITLPTKVCLVKAMVFPGEVARLASRPCRRRRPSSPRWRGSLEVVLERRPQGAGSHEVNNFIYIFVLLSDWFLRIHPPKWNFYIKWNLYFQRHLLVCPNGPLLRC